MIDPILIGSAVSLVSLSGSIWFMRFRKTKPVPAPAPVLKLVMVNRDMNCCSWSRMPIAEAEILEEKYRLEDQARIKSHEVKPTIVEPEMTKIQGPPASYFTRRNV